MASNLPNPASSCSDNDNNSEKEIFFGKITLKEMKRRFLRRQTIAHPCDDTPNNEENEINVRIIETHSEPDLTSSICSNTQSLSDGNTESNEYSEGYHSKTNDSETDVSVEHVINKMKYVLPSVSNGDVDLLNFYYENNDITELNSEVPIKSTNITIPNSSLQKKCAVMNVETPQNSVSSQPITPIYETPHTIIDEEKYFKTPEKQTEVKTDKQLLQPLKFPAQRNLFNKSSVNEVADNKASVNSVVHENKTGDHLIFKTPAKLPINKTNVVSSLKKTPKKCNNYEHIASPIAAYIKNSPQVPLLKDVKPRKQLVPVSGIPRLKDTTYPHKQHNKENVNLPEVAYRSAKNTKVIDNKDEPRMPQSGKMKKLLSSLPKPAIIKHDHRENMTNAKPLCGPEDSFANLSLHQADLSVCIKKSAMSPTPHKLKK